MRLPAFIENRIREIVEEQFRLRDIELRPPMRSAQHFGSVFGKTPYSPNSRGGT